MEFDLHKSIEILARTPVVLETLLDGLSEEWIQGNEGGDSWSPFDIVGHLIHGERSDWMQRLHIILSDNSNKTFTPFDRFAQFEESKNKTIRQLLDDFKVLRSNNLEILKSHNLTAASFSKKGIHPVFGEVTLQQLLSTWTVHDLAHLGQISRVMAKQYMLEVGPWKEYLPILTR
jgi:hypothetical protein